jgi:two-component system, LuxR family, sensor kinase FixL
MSARTSIVAGVGLLLAVGALDWFTGPQIALSVIYLIPITLVTWRNPRWAAWGIAVLSGATWLVVEVATNKTYTNAVIPFWNALVRTIFFCLVSGLMAEVRVRRHAEASLRQSQELLEQRARRLAESEAALQKQTSILQSIVNCMADGVLVTGSQGGLMLVNPAAKRLLQMPSPDAAARAWLGFENDHPVNGPTPRLDRDAPLWHAVRGEAVDGAEMFLRHQNSSEGIWLLVTGRPLLDPTGGITGAVIVLNNITAHKELERRVAEASDREQRRIGEDLHDGLCQQLVGAAFAARKLAARLSDLSLRETDDAAEIAELLGESIAQARDAARGLYLVQLEADGLISALEELAAQVRSRHGIVCQFVNETSVSIADETTVTSLFRIAQEAVNNALKHARASRITVTLAADDQQIVLDIEDNGRGLAPDFEIRGGMGLQIMNYRARMIGAAFSIGARSGGGTRVACSARRMNRAGKTTPAQPD